MAIVSYRIRCDGCSSETVIREDRMEESVWKINSKINHSGLCPACNDALDDSEMDGYSRDEERVPFEKLDNIGDTGADNLREKGIVTRADVAETSDEEILETAWVGKKGLKSIRQEVQ